MSNSHSLIAIILEVTPMSEGQLPFHIGNANFAATLAYLSTFNPAFVTATHDEDAPKPLTCSTLMGKITRRQGMAVLRRGERYWLRITGLNAEMCDLLRDSFLLNPPRTWILAGAHFEVLQSICDPALHEWSGTTTYEALWHEAITATAPASKFSLEIASPTAFRSDAITMTLPQPDLFFGSLVDRWNSLSPLPVDVAVRQWCRAWVEASRFDLETVLFEAKKRVKLVGAIGTITYSVRDPDIDGARLLHMLTNFAFYSGVGMKTSMGMGQVRRLQE